MIRQLATILHTKVNERSYYTSDALRVSINSDDIIIRLTGANHRSRITPPTRLPHRTPREALALSRPSFAAASSGLPDSQLHDLETLDHHTYDFFTCERLLCLLLDIAVLEEDFRAELSRSSLVLRLYTCADRNLVTVTHAAHRCFLMDVFIQNPNV